MNATNLGLNKIITVVPNDWCCSGSKLRQFSKPAIGENLDLPAIVNKLRAVLQTIEYGAGLSAIQIGIPFRVAVVNIARHPDKEIILIDPVLVAATGRLTTRSEGCLSLPHYKGKVKRKEKIVVKTFSLDGKEITIKSAGYEAAVIQHELDHMDGQFYWDRMENGQRPEPIELKTAMGNEPNTERGLAKAHWNDSYCLRKTVHLWGNDPVPFATKASNIFKEINCQTIADLPCGDGRNTVILAKEIPFVMGLDASQNALQLAQERSESEGVRNCIFQKCDIFQTNFQNEQFDGIFCWDVLGHLKTANEAMDEIIRICRKGGRIIGTLFATSDPNLGSEMVVLGENEYLYKEKYYYHFYTQQHVEEFLKRFPVQVLSIQLEKWSEPAHEGFREYPHEHHSWVFILKRN